MPLIRIEDMSDKRLSVYSGMTDGQLARGEGFRRDHPEGMFIGESQRVIERALDAGVVPLSLFVEESWLNHDQAVIQRMLAADPDIPVFVATPAQFHAITGYQVTRGSLACFSRPKLPSLEAVLEGARRVAIIEDVTNYANMGVIFRSAAALGMDAVLVSPSCHDPLYRRAARVSMGTVFQVPWTRLDAPREWAPQVVPVLHEAGFKVAALALREDHVDLDGLELAACDKLAVVLGTEGDGLFQSTIDACDFTVQIPMSHGVDSLNVAVTAGIVFWELGKR